MKATDFLHGSTANQVLFFLRAMQQLSVTITAFIASYFIYWHLALRDSIPLTLIPIFFACITTYLESYIASAFALYSRDPKPRHRTLLRTNLFTSSLLILGYVALTRAPYVATWQDGDNWFRPTRFSDGYRLEPAGVEEHNSALTCALLVCAAIAVSSTLVLTSFAGAGLVVEKKYWKQGFPSSRRRGGYTTVDEAIETCSLYSDDTLTVLDDTQKER